MRRSVATVVLAILLLPAASAAGQGSRYELARRLQILEAEWEAHPDARHGALPHVKEAVNAFFSLSLGGAAQALDRAVFALRSPDPPPPEAVWGASLSFRPERRVVAAGTEKVALTLKAVYAMKAPPPAEARLRVSLRAVGGAEARVLLESKVPALPFEAELPVADLPAGDHQLLVGIFAGEKPVASLGQGFSVVEKLEDRLKNARRAAEDLAEAAVATEVETARGLLGLVENLAGGKDPETDLEAGKLLSEAEATVVALGRGTQFHAGRAGESRLWLVTGTAKTPVRLFAPEPGKDPKPRPLVVAVHGVGGSENMWFEGYGRGAIVTLCRDRGWMLVAVRCGFVAPNLPKLIKELGRFHPLDKAPILLVGHSMGAGFALDAALKEPWRYAALAVLSGGRPTKDVERIRDLPVFVGAGAEDFALEGARSFHLSLRQAGGPRPQPMKEYPGTEHLMAVAAALPDVFAFFDAVLKP